MSRASFTLRIVMIGVLCGMTVAQFGGWMQPWNHEWISEVRCSPNEKWTVCGTACPLTCELPFKRDCSEHCVLGCECKEGYLRKSAKECVKDRADCYK